MSDKQVYDLTEEDILTHQCWYFPMDETVQDELTVRPAPVGLESHSDYQCIVRTSYSDASGGEYVGYVYWGRPELVQHLKPTMFTGKECITFWYGSSQPSLCDYRLLREKADGVFPIRFISERFGELGTIVGELLGLYFLNDDNEINYITGGVDQ